MSIFPSVCLSFYLPVHYFTTNNLTSSLPFSQDCLKTRDPDALKDLKFSCVFDLCASTEELDVKICRMAETIATECAEVDKIPVKNWRQSVESCPGAVSDAMLASRAKLFTVIRPAQWLFSSKQKIALLIELYFLFFINLDFLLLPNA